MIVLLVTLACYTLGGCLLGQVLRIGEWSLVKGNLEAAKIVTGL